MVVVAAGRDERGLVAHALLQLEAEHAAVEAERALEVGDLQVDVADVDARIDRGHAPTIASSYPGVRETSSSRSLSPSICRASTGPMSRT